MTINNLFAYTFVSHLKPCDVNKDLGYTFNKWITLTCLQWCSQGRILGGGGSNPSPKFSDFF